MEDLLKICMYVCTPTDENINVNATSLIKPIIHEPIIVGSVGRFPTSHDKKLEASFSK